MVVEVMMGEVEDHLKLTAAQRLPLGKIPDVGKEEAVAVGDSGSVCKADHSRA